jgi:5-methylcytosine-specific restriction endonuclease McrA
MDAALERQVWRRARRRCEYCQMPQEYDDAPFEVDHIIALKHGGRTRPSNLCLSCFSCNSFKGPNIAGIDPRTRKLTPLFHPRRHAWARHFRWQGACLLGRTPVGRATIAVLNINDPLRVGLRQGLIEEGFFPPP